MTSHPVENSAELSSRWRRKMAARLVTFSSTFELTASEIVYDDRLKCCEDIDSMFPGEIFSKERSLLLF